MGPVVLVLGMIHLSDAEYNRQRQIGVAGTTVSAVRDTARIKALASMLHADVYSVSWADVPTDPNFHIVGHFGKEVVEELAQRLQGQKFDLILGDYYRFPSDYFRQAYGSFIKKMWPALLNHGLIDVDTVTILPKLNPGLDTLPGGVSMYDPITMNPQLQTYYIQARDNPLYTATDQKSVQPFLNASNSEEIGNSTFDRKSPFLMIKLRTCAFHCNRGHRVGAGG